MRDQLRSDFGIESCDFIEKSIVMNGKCITCTRSQCKHLGYVEHVYVAFCKCINGGSEKSSEELLSLLTYQMISFHAMSCSRAAKEFQNTYFCKSVSSTSNFALSMSSHRFQFFSPSVPSRNRWNSSIPVLFIKKYLFLFFRKKSSLSLS